MPPKRKADTTITKVAKRIPAKRTLIKAALMVHTKGKCGARCRNALILGATVVIPTLIKAATNPRTSVICHWTRS